MRGSDEVAHLATSFNRMSREVERSQQSLRDFLADASHELRTPLTSIQGFSQALLDGALAGDEAGSAEAGRIINEESQRMRRLVEDLLYLSRVESRQVPGTQAPVDVAVLLREVLAPAAAHGRAARPGHPARRCPTCPRSGATPTSSTASSATSWRTPASTPPRGASSGVRRRAPGPDAGGHGAQHRERHPARGPAPRLRALLPRGQVPRPGRGGQRAGPGHRPGSGPAPPGADRGAAAPRTAGTTFTVTLPLAPRPRQPRAPARRAAPGAETAPAATPSGPRYPGRLNTALTARPGQGPGRLRLGAGAHHHL